MKSKSLLSKKPLIYHYINYREYLQAWYQYQKSELPRFSFRSFAEQIEVCSYNYLQRIISGTRNLSPKFIPNFAKVLELTKQESTYFSMMIDFATSKDSQGKTILLKRLISMREKEGKMIMKDQQLLFFDKWYRPIIRELVTIKPFNHNYKELAHRCIPKISENEAKEAVRYLRDNGFIVISEDGTYKQSSPVISTGDEIQSLFVRNYHKKTLSLLREIVDIVPPEEREISSLTFSVSGETFAKMKQEIQSFRKRIIELAQADDNPEAVYSASFQLVPRSENSKDI